MATEVTILAVRTLPSLDPRRAGKLDTTIIFKDNGNPSKPDTVIVPSESPSEAEIRTALAARIKSKSALEGKTITLP
jgi:hypothetical protein